jgi:hypothetical protein
LSLLVCQEYQDKRGVAGILSFVSYLQSTVHLFAPEPFRFFDISQGCDKISGYVPLHSGLLDTVLIYLAM